MRNVVSRWRKSNMVVWKRRRLAPDGVGEWAWRCRGCEMRFHFGSQVELEEMAVVCPPTPIADGKSAQAIDREGFASEVTVAGTPGLCAIGGCKDGPEDNVEARMAEESGWRSKVECRRKRSQPFGWREATPVFCGKECGIA